MKIVRIIAVLLALLFLLTACSRGDEPRQDEVFLPYESSESNGADESNESNGAEETIEQPPEEEQEPLLTALQMREVAREKLLADFDYLVEELYANMPLFGVIYRRTNTDLMAYFVEMREHLATTELFGGNAEDMEQMNEAAATYLFNYLNGQIPHRVQGLGHLYAVPREEYMHMLVATKLMLEDPDFNNPSSQILLDTLANPAAMRFYGVNEAELDIEDDTHLMFRTDIFAVSTRIHTPGEIAHITIRHAMNDLDFDKGILFPFYEEIQDYPHLIIDISNHSGGRALHFTAVVMQPLLTVPVQVYMHEFFMDGERATSAIEEQMFFFNELPELVEEVPFAEISLYNAAEYVALHDMTEFNPQDLEKLSYVLEFRGYIEPMEDGFPFNGKIWLLTGRLTASAGESAVLAAQSSGFATVVGMPTMGVMPSTTEFVLLPNTGIIFRMDIAYFTDAQGRSLEEFGIAPDIQSNPWQRALDTVLELIAEGQ